LNACFQAVEQIGFRGNGAEERLNSHFLFRW
jgi:hypothetical protein